MRDGLCSMDAEIAFVVSRAQVGGIEQALLVLL
jgi:hypothetical protein